LKNYEQYVSEERIKKHQKIALPVSAIATGGAAVYTGDLIRSLGLFVISYSSLAAFSGIYEAIRTYRKVEDEK